MLSDQRLRDAGQYVEWLRTSVHNKPLPNSLRIRAAVSCLAIAQEHHHSIVLLIEHQLYASSFSLLRVCFEAYIRGMWLSICASEAQVTNFFQGTEPPKTLLKDLEQNPEFSDKFLSSLHARHWKTMCGYTHTGGIHVQRWNTNDGVEPNYEEQEVKEVLIFSELIGSLAALGVADAAKDDILRFAILEKMKLLTA